MNELAEQITLLIELQRLDTQIYGLNKRKRAAPLLIKDMEDGLRRRGEGLKELESALKSLLVRQKEKEIELASKEETIKKCRTQLYQIKTNKEYAAMQKEIDSYKADKSAMEDEIIIILDEVDEKKREIEKEKAALNEEGNRIDKEKERVNSELREIEKGLGSLNAQRAESTGMIDKETLNKYERILKGKDGLAMVPVCQSACGGCHLNLPPQVINEISMRENLVFCESCARILYIEE